MAGGRGQPGARARGDDERERRLAQLVSDYMDRLNDGAKIDLETVAREHGSLGPEIVEQIRFFVGCFGDSGSTEPTPFRTLGEFTLRGEVGRGGMGVVYDAWQRSLDRRVALKILTPGIAADARSVGRFLREAKAAAQLKHPNLVAGARRRRRNRLRR